MPQPGILHSDGYPLSTDFASGKGTPIVVNTENGRAYVLVGSTITPLGGHVVDVRDFDDIDSTGSNDSTTPLQTALSELATAGGGVLFYPKGTYVATATLATSSIVHMVGEGANASILQISHTAGPAVTFTRYFSGIRSMGVRGSSARLAAAAGTNYGIFFPTDSAVAQSRFANYVRDCQITNHSSHGVYLTGQGAVVEDCRVLDVGGHGVYGDNFDADANYVFGFTEIKNTQMVRCTGHAVAVGINRLGFRLSLDNVDAYHCALTAGVRQSAHTLWLNCENLSMKNCGIGGWSGDSPSRVLAVAGAFVNGRSPVIENNRFIDVSGHIVQLGANADGARVIDNQVTGEVIAALDPAVVVDSGCTGVYVRFGFPANVTKAMTTAAVNTGNHSEFYDISPQGLRSAINAITIADDAVHTFNFTGVTHGVMVLSGNSLTARGLMVSFRVGDANAYCAHITNPTGVAAGTNAGTPTGTTGTDGNLTIYADTTASRLHIENRRGASLNWTPTFLSLASGELVL